MENREAVTAVLAFFLFVAGIAGLFSLRQMACALLAMVGMAVVAALVFSGLEFSREGGIVSAVIGMLSLPLGYAGGAHAAAGALSEGGVREGQGDDRRLGHGSGDRAVRSGPFEVNAGSAQTKTFCTSAM